jgi:type IX secretion system PorP/SprF family membrane protein
MKKAFLIILILFSKNTIGQIGLINQYHFNYLAINPALAGENSPFTIKAILGNQFNGSIRPNEVNQVLVLDGQLFNKAGLAFQGYRNNTGNVISTGLGFSYARGYEIGDLKLKIGANAGIFIQPNLLAANLTQRVLPHGGLGVIGSYRGVFLGISNPLILSARGINEQKPLLANAGYIFENESIFDFNVNILLYNDFKSQKRSYDLNFKGTLNHRFGLGFSYRANKVFAYTSQTPSFVPFAEYKVARSMSFALSYDSNPPTFGSSSAPNLSLGGIFQVMVRYNNDDTGGDSWFFGKF